MPLIDWNSVLTLGTWIAHNPKVAGSNPASATKFTFYQWSQTILNRPKSPLCDLRD